MNEIEREKEKFYSEKKTEYCLCDAIYPDDDTTDIIFWRGKYSHFNKDGFITINREGKYDLNIETDDPYEPGCLCDIKFCPYCGRKLTESEDTE